MNTVDKIIELENKLLELQSANLELTKENNILKTKVSKLETANKDLDTYNSTLQDNFLKQEEFISLLKRCSEQLNNLFFEDETRRY